MNDQPFWKYHGLGNDYLVVDAAAPLTPTQAQRICHRHYGIGSDGILQPLPANGRADFAVRIFNPDGSEAEKSGNGLRIFARYLFDTGRVQLGAPFTVWTAGGVVTATVLAPQRVRVSMGRARFLGLGETLVVGGGAVGRPATAGGRPATEREWERDLRVHVVSMGNPHCVIVTDAADLDVLAQQLGSAIETHPRFPARTNVQFMRVAARDRVEIAIWERGAGYTLASGSSSCAAAAVARRLGLCDAAVTVAMAGGELQVEMGRDWEIMLTGAVVKVGVGVISAEIFDT